MADIGSVVVGDSVARRDGRDGVGSVATEGAEGAGAGGAGSKEEVSC